MAAGAAWCRLLDASLEPVAPRIATGLGPVWFAATDGEHLVITDNGFMRILDSGGRERARVAGHVRHLVHDPLTGTWVAIHESEQGQAWLLRFDHDAGVLQERACERPRDAATVRGGRALVLLTDAGVQVLDCSDWSTRVLGDA